MRPKLENPPTKRRILDSAQALMLTQGYAGTSVDEVCAKAKVTKGNFFYYFKNKEELGRELVERFASDTKSAFCSAASCGGSDPLERIYCCIDFMAEMSQRPGFKGCLVGTFSQEAEAIGPKLLSICGKSFEEGAGMFRRDFAEAARKYPPKAGFNAKRLADFFMSAMQGSFVLMKAKGGDRKIVQSNLKLMKSYLKSVFGK